MIWRAKAAIEKTNADLGIGLEGGVIRRAGRYFVTGWCAVVDRNGEVALGYSGGVELPEKVVRAVLEGRELGDVMDEFVGIRNVKKKMGAIGILTNGLSNRRKATEEVIIYAMAKRFRPELYK